MLLSLSAEVLRIRLVLHKKTTKSIKKSHSSPGGRKETIQYSQSGFPACFCLTSTPLLKQMALEGLKEAACYFHIGIVLPQEMHGHPINTSSLQEIRLGKG